MPVMASQDYMEYWVNRNPVRSDEKKVQANFCEALILQISKTRPFRLQIASWPGKFTKSHQNLATGS